jgi:hypothetical protein
MIFEPESWTGLRSSGAVAGDLGETLGASAVSRTARPSALRSAAHFVAVMVDRIAHRHDGGFADPSDFLRARRLTVFDEPRR